MPADDDLDEWHEWSLKMGKGTIMLTRYLWKDASKDVKAKAKGLIENYVKTTFEKYYVLDEGAFSYYPNSEHATFDGTGGTMNKFSDISFFRLKSKEIYGVILGDETVLVHTFLKKRGNHISKTYRG